MTRAATQPASHTAPDGDHALKTRLEALRAMPVSALQDAYHEAYGRATPTRNRDWLVRRIFLRVQETLTGASLSQQARARIEALAEGQQVRVRPATPPPPLPDPEPVDPDRDPRLPPPGTILRRAHEGVTYEIRVLRDGFELGGRFYASLSTIAREITGTSWNGFLWAGLAQRKSRARTGDPA